jgi:phosphopantetheine adenylyltransferase
MIMTMNMISVPVLGFMNANVKQHLSIPQRHHQYQYQPTKLHSTESSSSSSSSSNSNENSKSNGLYKHTLAILTLPQTSTDRIANEAILETCMKHTSDKLSIVLRMADNNNNVNKPTTKPPKINELRGYVGEIYSMAWDVALNVKPTTDNELLNIIIYPHNLPNAAPEAWITHRPNLDCICSHSSIIGWVSNTSTGSKGNFFVDVEGSGKGGLESHVEAVNIDRKARGLSSVVGLEVDNWPDVCRTHDDINIDDNVVFLEDDYDTNDNNNDVHVDVHGDVDSSSNTSNEQEQEISNGSQTNTNDSNINENDISSDAAVGHYRIPSSSLYNSVAVGGTWDGLHYGHRKLLTLAISSVIPNTGGKLLIGITTDEMLQQKEHAELIPTLKERIKGVRDFVDDLAPGMKNRIKIIPIKDAYGPPGSAIDSNVYDGIENDFDALVLSHETLPTGNKLNHHRVDSLGMEPLTLLCTRRTEAHGMSSTTLRRIRSQQSLK